MLQKEVLQRNIDFGSCDAISEWEPQAKTVVVAAAVAAAVVVVLVAVVAVAMVVFAVT